MSESEIAALKNETRSKVSASSQLSEHSMQVAYGILPGNCVFLPPHIFSLFHSYKSSVSFIRRRQAAFVTSHPSSVISQESSVISINCMSRQQQSFAKFGSKWGGGGVIFFFFLEIKIPTHSQISQNQSLLLRWDLYGSALLSSLPIFSKSSSSIALQTFYHHYD